jgi:hypothetical protein
LKLKHSLRRLFFKSIDAELAYNRQAIELLLKSTTLAEREAKLQSKILLSYLDTFQELKTETGLTTPFQERIVVKYNI